MRTRSWSVAVVAAALVGFVAPARAAEADARAPCREFARRYQGSPVLAWAGELMQAEVAHRTTKSIVGSLAKAEEGWAEGNPHWERAYALLLPEVSRLIGLETGHTRRRQEASLALRLKPASCRAILAVLATPAGDAAFRVQFASNYDAMLSEYVEQFPLPARLQGKLSEVRGRLAREKALAGGPAAGGARARFEAADRELRGFDPELLQAVRDPLEPIAEPRPDMRAGAQRMIEQHRATLVAILEEFRARRQ